MKTRRLGPDGPEVSVLGIGAMSFSDMYGPVTEAQAHALLDAALEAGVTHLDTADIYGMGRSEEAIGRWLARYRQGGATPFRIATKAGITSDPTTDARVFDNSAAHLEAALDASLRRLGLDRVDLFYVHRRDPSHEIEAVTETLAGLIAKGKIGAVGFSEIAPTSLARAQAVHPVAAVQSEYSLATRLPELGLVQACEATGTALVAFSPLGRGLLTDRPPTPDRAAASGFLRSNPRFTGDNLARNVAATAPFRALAAEMGTTAAALAIAWVLHRSPATLAIPGTRSTAHFAELVDGATRALEPADMAEVARRLPAGWAHGARYSAAQSVGPEDYC